MSFRDQFHLTLKRYYHMQIGELKRLKTFNVANNLLSGLVPTFAEANFPVEIYDNNIGLCGGPLERCSDDQSKFLSAVKSGFAVGYAISAVSVVVMYVSYFVPWLNTGKRSTMITIAAMLISMMKRKKKIQIDRVVSLSTVEILRQNKIYKMGEGEAKVMEWPVRVKIVVGLAGGLAWLHHDSNMLIIHLNISSKCILLDENFKPKLSNFEEAMILCSKDVSCVTVKFWEEPFIKEDVLSFGVILLELIMSNDRSKMTCSLTNCDGFQDEWLNHLLNSSSNFYDMIDKSLIGQEFDAQMSEFLKIAFRCTQSIPDQRPTIR
ncbi:serine-threonine protein kinase, plant-type, putative [Ricinus communis]|uniref:Serine-threonine protein kinase, plant-type, putative n=1 Tax=Ricinus communis TaxID=3988 RepID=B9SUY9_RICCO|nr:serine-threonine protein kinase, plant-type, putative [Ricinus communis]